MHGRIRIQRSIFFLQISFNWKSEARNPKYAINLPKNSPHLVRGDEGEGAKLFYPPPPYPSPMEGGVGGEIVDKKE